MDYNISTLGRLLRELSWEGRNITKYRNGGRGYENVLTAETFQGLDLLPRTMFLGEVIAAAHGASATRNILYDEIEEATTKILPGSFYLIKNANSHQESLAVQPDGVITSPNCFTILEVKRLRENSYQTEQLAREYTLVMLEARGNNPLLLLVLDSEPPVKVKNHGKLTIEQSITQYLDKVLEQATRHELTSEKLASQIPEVVSWITWAEIKQIVVEQKQKLPERMDDKSIQRSVERLSDSIIQAIDFHS